VKAKTKMRGIGLNSKKAMAGYVFMIPLLIGLVFIFIPSFVQAIIYSFHNIRLTGGEPVLEWIGFHQYERLLFAHNTAPYILTSLQEAAVQVPIIVIFSLVISNLLNDRFKGRAFVRAIFFLPAIAAAGILAQLSSSDLLTDIYMEGSKLDAGMASANVYNYDSLKNLLMASDINQTFISIILGAVDGLYNVVTASGVQILIFLSGIQSISPSLYEAAKVEGGNGWVNFWKITFPMISPLIMVNTVYTMIDSFLSYNNQTMQMVRNHLYSGDQMSYAIALALLYIAVVAILLIAVYLVLSRFIRSQR